jgi:hypothetical protein
MRQRRLGWRIFALSGNEVQGSKLNAAIDLP